MLKYLAIVVLGLFVIVATPSAQAAPAAGLSSLKTASSVIENRSTGAIIAIGTTIAIGAILITGAIGTTIGTGALAIGAAAGAGGGEPDANRICGKPGFLPGFFIITCHRPSGAPFYGGLVAPEPPPVPSPLSESPAIAGCTLTEATNIVAAPTAARVSTMAMKEALSFMMVLSWHYQRDNMTAGCERLSPISSRPLRYATH